MRKKQLVFLFLLLLTSGLILPNYNSVLGQDDDLGSQYGGGWGVIQYEEYEGEPSLGGFWGGLWKGIFKIINSVTGAFLKMSYSLLKWVMSDKFVSEKFTQNDFVTPAWEIMKNIANIIVILGFIIIALATILKIQEYQAQKTLPWLFIAILLINFSPVICGIFIDASTIAMNYFLKMGTLGTNIVDAVQDWRPGEIQPFQQGAVIAIFNITAGIIFLLYSLLFLARYVALWMLVIISPVAFVCRALPFAKKIWGLWWNQFLQWCFIGIPAAFTIYITNKMIIVLEKGKLVRAATGDVAGYSFLIYLIPLAFLIGGFFMSLQTGAMGANIITGFFEKQVKGGGARLGKAATRTAARRLTGPMAGATAKGISTLTRKTEKVPLLNWVTRRAETITVPALTEYAAKQRKIKKPEGWDQMSIPEKEMFVSAKGMAQDRLVLASIMAEEGTFQKSGPAFQKKMLEVAEKFSKDPRYLKEVGDILGALPDKMTKKMKIDLELAPIDPKAIDKETGELKRDVERRKLELKIKAIASEFEIDEDKAAAVLHTQEFKPKDISKISKGSLKTDAFRLAMRKMKSSNLQALRNSFDSETIKAVLDEGRGLNTITEDELKIIARENPDLVRWTYHTPAGRETLNWADKWKTPPKPAPAGKKITSAQEWQQKKEEEILEDVKKKEEEKMQKDWDKLKWEKLQKDLEDKNKK